ncbi:sulfatase-like hydrolase/transferase [Nonomuraea thailandensis]
MGAQAGDKEPRFPPARRDRPKNQFPAGEFPHGDCGGPDCASIDVAALPAFDEDTADKPSWVRREPIGPNVVKELRKDFRDRIRMVQSVDDMVERVLAALSPEELRTTYVVFTSDNGFHLGQHRLLRGKSTAYDHDVRVPLLVKRPEAGGTASWPWTPSRRTWISSRPSSTWRASGASRVTGAACCRSSRGTR